MEGDRARLETSHSTLKYHQLHSVLIQFNTITRYKIQITIIKKEIYEEKKLEKMNQRKFNILCK